MPLTYDFLSKVNGLKVSVSLTSEVPAGYTPAWDFGVSGGSIVTETSYTYAEDGRYLIKLFLRDDSSGVISDQPVSQHYVVVSSHANTSLIDTIYVLIDQFIPQDDNLVMTMQDKAAYITKWQLYLQPLVNHEVPMAEYSNEYYYEGLENQLIMELAAYDFLCVRIQRLLTSTSESIGSSYKSRTTGDGGDRIKQITTGPTEVQYFDTVSEAMGSSLSAYANATKPGGLLDVMRMNLCTLAQRLDIFLPFCSNPNHVKTPKVVNRRKPGPLDGPNPGALIV